MGAVSGEELVKWEKMGGVGGHEEKILVLVRLRPLSEKEIDVNEAADWECINDTTILYRNTLREGSSFPSAYTFDRVFRGDCSTKQVYEEGAKEIALSVVGGINSCIFAYGQTSSGKTYTMIGITEYAVADIFDYINKHEERAFVLKFSAIEIYNEIIRDLLITKNTSLRLRDDPERGPIVEKLTEETLRDWVHLKELLSFCEAQRQVGETYLNDKSSRSHQIIRLTIESSAREFMGKSSSTTLAASVNFVDLAGSERASQALSAGSRLKEGCHINRSLLTLGTVIRKLSKGRQGHINYRDSKLTRILQPSLGGNSRTAIICTLSPARSHVEQTRNTLLFACCAKQVTTKAQVNVVMSDKVLVKQLQKEVARLESELRTPCPPSTNCDCAAMLRKKNLQIQKMEREIRELIEQRHLAQSQVEDLLRMVGNDQKSRKERMDTWEDDDSISESSSTYPSDLRIREFNNPHYNNENSESSPDKHPDECCKEIQSVELEESSRDDLEYADLSVSNNGVLALTLYGEKNVISQEIPTPVNEDREEKQNQLTYGVLEQRLDDSQLSNDSPMTMSETVPNCRNFKLLRSWSCREYYTSSSPEKAGVMERTPASSFEKCFPGRPDELQRKFLPLTYGSSTKLSMNGSPSSVGSPSMDELRTNSMRSNANEDVTSLQTFVAGMKEMAKLEYEKQLVDDDQDQQAETTTFRFEKNMKDVGVGSMLEAPESPVEWPLQFKQQQREIVELWQACKVSLFHRTYFFLLFRGDPTDSIYMEVEFRRLSFLKETFASGNQSMNASSAKGVQREREVLVKLMQRRLSEEERKNLFSKWGIELDSKRRRKQLANRIWSSTDMNHIVESAAVVAKLLSFTGLKEMFGLSFSPHTWASLF
ncbi:kinesin-like protein KIN-7E isoform X1 [Glycine soja]|uniref:Kinesin-like protein n=2 Tax=Glycine soja TaxID=3848 RepID=A0A445K319_GLYSO|nr:kinesin-like protein KIN-7E isoform X1 [Glycine soja]XP_028234522.1 kinesin-like protein KIN-7E isoform X1 [Glycine soja]XP_028234523.1 kinesin-like protein KIN-7E isoform X1 [Glycine soja]XP_028234524.1 kinesin-like protein KIN-7E isoform X1 [Glycine soja]RZC05168.1 Kinesin-like protein KIN-7E isoform A [Glycine soja]RZC05169.1 Kinesin-like protein KIN-7E isoform B [Glycine soja]